MKHEFALQVEDIGARYMMAFNQHPDLAPETMPETAHIGPDGPLFIVTGEYDDAFLEGRIDAYYDAPRDWDYLIQETIYDIQNIMWFELQNPPIHDEEYADLSEEEQVLKWRNYLHTYTEHGLMSEFVNDEYDGTLRFKTYSTCGTTGEDDEPFVGMIVGHMKERLKSIIEHMDE